MGRTIAAFDFDGTLSRRDTVLPFLVRMFGPLRVARALGLEGPGAARARLSRVTGELHHRDATKAAILRRLFSGEDPARLAEHGEAYAAQTLPNVLRSGTVEHLDRHLDAGHEVVIVSASLAAYLGPFAVARGISHVIGVELQTGPDGSLSGEMVGPNIRGAEKATRLRSWLGGQEPDEMWAYGNSSGDRELLAMADHPVWIGRAGRQRDR